MLKDPKHPMIPGTSLKMCPVASVDVFVQLYSGNLRCFCFIFYEALKRRHSVKGGGGTGSGRTQAENFD